MVKDLFFIGLLSILSECLCCQVSFFYDGRSLKKEGHYEISDFWTGVPKEALILYDIRNEDTILLYRSFGCTQYHFNEYDNTLKLYIWPRYYYDSDCLCVGDDERPCRPDTNESDLRIILSFNKFVASQISDIPFGSYGEAPQNYSIDSLEKSLNDNRYIKLNWFRKTFNKHLFRESYEQTLLLIDNYYDLFFIRTNKDIDLEILDKNVMYIYDNYGDLNPSVFANYEYVRDLVRYIKPMQGEMYEEERINEFSDGINKIR